MVIFLVSSIAHQGTGYEHGLEHGGAEHLLVSFLEYSDKHQAIWPRLEKKSRNLPNEKDSDHVEQS